MMDIHSMDLPYLMDYKNGSFFLIAGPCVIEGRDLTFSIAEKIVRLSDRHQVPVIFKASYRKANRSRYDSFTGIGDEEGLRILSDIKSELKVPVLTDIHSAGEAGMAARFVDVLQIPAFLCRQTDILEAAAATGKCVNIKKGQFLAPESMKFAVEKVRHAGNDRIILTDRGTQFGYGDLVVDYRAVPVMKENGVPVVLDVTHSLQKPNQASGVTGGMPQMIETMARAGIAAGVDGIFLETHPDPASAKSDGANMLNLANLENLIVGLKVIREAVLSIGSN